MFKPMFSIYVCENTIGGMNWSVNIGCLSIAERDTFITLPSVSSSIETRPEDCKIETA